MIRLCKACKKYSLVKAMEGKHPKKDEDGQQLWTCNNPVCSLNNEEFTIWEDDNIVDNE